MICSVKHYSVSSFQPSRPAGQRSVVGLSAVKSVARWATDTDAMALTAKNSAVLLNFMKNSC